MGDGRHRGSGTWRPGRRARRGLRTAVAVLLTVPLAALAPTGAGAAQHPQDAPLVLGHVPWPQIGVGLGGTVTLSEAPGPVSSQGTFGYAQDQPTTAAGSCDFVQPDGVWMDGYAVAHSCTTTVEDGTYSAAACDVAALHGTIVLLTQNETLRMTVDVSFAGTVGTVTGTFWRDDESTGDITGTMLATAHEGTPACSQSFHVQTVMYLTPDRVTGMTGLLTAPANAEQAEALTAHRPDLAALAAKRQIVVRNAPQVSAWLVQNATRTTGPEDPCPDVGCLGDGNECLAQPGVGPVLPEPFCAPAPPTPPPAKFNASISGAQAQEKWYYCVPAAAAIMLVSQGGTNPGQDQLAYEMKTSENGGTLMENAVDPLNKYRNEAAPHLAYVYDTVGTPRDLLDVAIAEAWDMRQAAMMGINMATVGYYDPSWYGSNHAVVLYGYDTAGGGYVQLYDPFDPTRFRGSAARNRYGPHKVAVKDAWSSMSNAGLGVVW